MQYKKEIEIKELLPFFDYNYSNILKYISQFFKEKKYIFGQIHFIDNVDFNYSKDDEDKYFIHVKNKDMCHLYDQLLITNYPNILLNEWKLNSKYLVHIPHCGTKIPQKYLDDYLIDEEELTKNIYEYADLYTNELFKNLLNYSGGIENKYSRLFFDPERFFDDDIEEMQKKYKLGWFYENSILKKEPLRINKNKNEISKYYMKYHQELNDLCKERIDVFGECIIIDCHSFSNDKYWFHDKDIELPDICIGFEEKYKDEKIIELFCDVFKDYKISFNNPYKGSLVPTEYYGKDFNVRSVMIEINKKLYLEDDNITKSQNYHKLETDLKLFFYKLFYKY